MANVEKAVYTRIWSRVEFARSAAGSLCLGAVHFDVN